MALSIGTVAAQPVAEDACDRGRRLFEARHFLEAREAFRACLDSSGDSIDALLPLTIMAVTDGRYPTAEQWGRRAVTVDPENVEARYWYGRALLRQGKTEEAKAQWEAGLQRSTEHAGILEALARLALAQGEDAKGYNLLSQLQHQGLDDGWLHRLLGEIAASKGLWAQALGHLDDTMARDGATIEDLLTASQLAILAEQNDRSIRYCRRAVGVEPSAVTHGALGEAFFAADAVDSALFYLEKAVAAEPRNPHYLFNLANTLEIIGDYQGAGKRFEDYLALRPDDPIGRFNYGIHLDKQGREEEALIQVQEAVRLDPDMLSAQVVLAQMYENRSDWSRAEAVVQVLLTKDQANRAELDLWLQRLREQASATNAAEQAGKVHLLHMVLADAEVLDRVKEELAAGADFGGLVVRFSSGPAASRGGDIGWLDPNELVEPLASAVKSLAKNEISPPLEAQGLYHLFKRIP